MSQYPTCKHNHGDMLTTCPKCDFEDLKTERDELRVENERLAAEGCIRLRPEPKRVPYDFESFKSIADHWFKSSYGDLVKPKMFEKQGVILNCDGFFTWKELAESDITHAPSAASTEWEPCTREVGK